MSIQINGGSAAQQTVIRQAHAQAVTMATAAQSAAPGGGTTFTLWFGTATASTVGTHFSEIVAALTNYAWTYDLTNITASNPEADVFLSPKSVDMTATAVTVVVWQGVFMQSAAATGQRMAALSAIHIAAEIREDWTVPSFVENAAAAQRYAVVDPDGAAACPRNYMEYAGAVTPA